MLLIVDDDVDLRQLLVEFLGLHGHEVHSARNGSDALEWLKGCQTFPRVILLDLAMPVLDGWGFLRERDKDKRLKLVPVIVMSGSIGVAEQAKEAGATVFLRKPFDPRAMLPIVEQFLLAA
jgi:CheY-like chemotaxis protein